MTRSYDFTELCDRVVVELDFMEPSWRHFFSRDDVVEWLTDAWPLSSSQRRDPSAVARACLDELEQAQEEAFAASA